jgi:hypothetical protein
VLSVRLSTLLGGKVRHVFSSFVLSAMLVAAGPAAAATGSALGVAQGANVEQAAGKHVLTVGEDVFIGDLITTNASGQVQIKFDDGTELVVGPASSLRIEDYLLRSDGSAGKFAINALGGTFRFVTGSAPKNRYQIETPTGTIGIRGTAFDFNVDRKATQVLVYHGTTILCSDARQCVELNDSCEVGQYDSRDSEVIGRTKRVDAQTRANLRAAFRYAQTQRPLLSAFRISQAENCFPKSMLRDEPPPTPKTGAIVPVVPPVVDPPPVTPPPVDPPPVDPPPVDPPPVDPPPVDPPPCGCGGPPGGGDHHDDEDEHHEDSHGRDQHEHHNDNHNGGNSHGNHWGNGRN